jgi:2-iminobutanoate/2-iminopropanoate deaminase
VKRIHTDNAPAAVGPYSQGIDAGNLVFCSGQAGLDPATGQLVEGVEAQTRQIFSNLSAVLEAAGLSLDDVVKTTVFLADMADFKAMNAIYATFFGETPPARSTVAV